MLRLKTTSRGRGINTLTWAFVNNLRESPEWILDNQGKRPLEKNGWQQNGQLCVQAVYEGQMINTDAHIKVS